MRKQVTRRRFFHNAFAGAALAGLAWLVPPASLLTGRASESAPLSDTDVPLFEQEAVLEQARALASRPFERPGSPSDPALRMSYDQYRSIEYDRSKAIWIEGGAPFRLEFFHPGFIYNEPVDVYLVEEDGAVAREDFSPTLFRYGGTSRAPSSPDLGFSGFRAHARINSAEAWDEFVVFQGATYFRAVGRAQSYGISGRGLAIGTAHPRGEEFPRFTKFWVERPKPGAGDLVVHALMDSPSTTGAFRFVIAPGETTTMDVEMTLFPRTELTSVGLAPLTSMFLFDQTNRWGFDDFRNAVHDSDGLQILNGNGEQIWRPLSNPRRLQMSAFMDDRPRGFGLMQRKREPGDFADFTARYEDRPSLWVEPLGDWGRGAVVLVEIPTERESNDNIVAFWRPRAPIPAGKPFNASYRLYWGDRAPIGSTLMEVERTRTGASMAGRRFFAVDFDPGLNPVPAEYLDVKASATGGKVSEPVLMADPETGTRRVTFEFDPENRDLVELRLQLTAGDSPASETWLYRWTPG